MYFQEGIIQLQLVHMDQGILQGGNYSPGNMLLYQTCINWTFILFDFILIVEGKLQEILTIQNHPLKKAKYGKAVYTVHVLPIVIEQRARFFIGSTESQ